MVEITQRPRAPLRVRPHLPIARGAPAGLGPIDGPVISPGALRPGGARCRQVLRGLLPGNISSLPGNLLLHVCACLSCVLSLSLSSSQLCKRCLPASASPSCQAGSSPASGRPPSTAYRGHVGVTTRDAFPSPSAAPRAAPWHRGGAGQWRARE